MLFVGVTKMYNGGYFFPVTMQLLRSCAIVVVATVVFFDYFT